MVEARRVALRWLTLNAIWIVPGLIVQWSSPPTMTAATAFRPRFDGLASALALPLGIGYWDRAAETIDGHRGAIALIGIFVVVAAAVGWRTVPAWPRRSMGWCLAVGFGVPVLAGLPGTSTVVDALTRSPIGGPLRDPQRLMGLGVVPTIVLAALGLGTLATAGGRGLWAWLDARTAHRSHRSHRLGRPHPPQPLHPSQRWQPWFSAGVVLAVGAVAVVWLARAQLTVVHRRLEPVPVAASWTAAADEVDRHPGTVLALPWHEYVRVDVPGAGSDAGGDAGRDAGSDAGSTLRRVLTYNPLADLLGGDVIASADPELGRPVQEAAEPRAATARAIQADLLAGVDVMASLTQLGVTWIAVLPTEEGPRIRAALDRAASVTRVVDGPDLFLYQLAGTTPVVTPAEHWGPVAWSGRPGAIVAGPGGRGWWGAATAENGSLRMTGSFAVYVPSLLSLAACGAWLIAALAALVSRRPRRRW